MKNLAQLLAVLSGAQAAYRDLARGCKLPQMDRELSEREMLGLCYYESVLQQLNKMGAIKDGWIAANPVQLLQPDSGPVADDYD